MSAPAIQGVSAFARSFTFGRCSGLSGLHFCFYAGAHRVGVMQIGDAGPRRGRRIWRSRHAVTAAGEEGQGEEDGGWAKRLRMLRTGSKETST